MHQKCWNMNQIEIVEKIMLSKSCIMNFIIAFPLEYYGHNDMKFIMHGVHSKIDCRSVRFPCWISLCLLYNYWPAEITFLSILKIYSKKSQTSEERNSWIISRNPSSLQQSNYPRRNSRHHRGRDKLYSSTNCDSPATKFHPC